MSIISILCIELIFVIFLNVYHINLIVYAHLKMYVASATGVAWLS